MPLSFRPARPEDVDAAVPLIYSSGPDAFDYAFARPGRNSAQDFLRHAFVQGGGQFGWRQHTVGELDGRVVAVGTVFGGEANLGYLLAASRQIFGFFGLGAAAVIRRGLQLERIICPPPQSITARPATGRYTRLKTMLIRFDPTTACTWHRELYRSGYSSRSTPFTEAAIRD